MNVTDSILKSPELSDEALATLREEVVLHPYFHAAAIALTSTLYARHSSDYGTIIRRTAISIPDRTALFALIEGKDYKIQPKQHTGGARSTSVAENADRTTSLIDHFLGTLPEEKPRKLTVADAATDYMSYLLQSEGEDTTKVGLRPMRGQTLIDDFIGSNAEGERIVLPDTEIEPPRVEDDEETLSPEYFTETMARIYIKQGKFEKASKIISRLNAKYPKKNRYFADQMRFLDKLIINQQAANRQ